MFAKALTMIVVRYRDTNTIRSSSFEFCVLIFLGSFLTYASGTPDCTAVLHCTEQLLFTCSKTLIYPFMFDVRQ
jgi:hypothetical protein